MADLGRVIKEADFPHSADYYSLAFAEAGLSYVVEGVGNECAVSKTANDVTIQGGDVYFGDTNEKRSYGGTTITISASASGGHRYDIIWLQKDGTGGVEALHTAGTRTVYDASAGDIPTHPDLPYPTVKVVVPICVVHFGDGSDTIDDLKDVRTVKDAWMRGSDEFSITQSDINSGDGLVCDSGKLGSALKESSKVFDVDVHDLAGSYHGSDSLANLNSKLDKTLISETNFNSHSTRHEETGGDEINIEGLVTNVNDGLMFVSNSGSVTTELSPLSFRTRSELKTLLSDSSNYNMILDAPIGLAQIVRSTTITDLIIGSNYVSNFHDHSSATEIFWNEGLVSDYGRIYWQPAFDWGGDIELRLADSNSAGNGIKFETQTTTNAEIYVHLSYIFDLTDYNTLRWYYKTSSGSEGSYESRVHIDDSVVWTRTSPMSNWYGGSVDVSGYSGTHKVGWGLYINNWGINGSWTRWSDIELD